MPILRSLPRETGEPFRIVGRAHALVPGTSALYELEDVRGYEAMTFSRYVATYDAWCTHQPVWFNRVDDLTKPFLSMINVRYAIASDERARARRLAARGRAARRGAAGEHARLSARLHAVARRLRNAVRRHHQGHDRRARLSRARLDRGAAAGRRARQRRRHRGRA